MRLLPVFTVLAAVLWLAFGGVATAQSNPCAGKAMNPCGDTANPCNPCNGKPAAALAVAVNPCHAKHGTVF